MKQIWLALAFAIVGCGSDEPGLDNPGGELPDASDDSTTIDSATADTASTDTTTDETASDTAVPPDSATSGDTTLDAGTDARTDTPTLETSVDTASTDAAVPRTTRTYTELTGDVLNPERGWHDWIDIVTDRNVTSTRTGGKTLSYARVILPSNVDTLPATLLTNIGLGLAAVRTAGTKVVLRFYYHEVYPNGENLDPAVARVVSHIGQLKTVLANNADVISVIEAGFVGPWGEFHSSHLVTSGEWKQVIDALFAALPAGRMMQFRTPMRKDAYFPAHGALADAEAFTNTNVARAGHFNDCFLASSDDSGTYATPVATWKTFVAADTRFTPMGGETCASPGRADCTTARTELAQLHFSFLNSNYHLGVVHPTTGLWAQQGCRDEITRKLGYRFVLERATHSQAVRPGDRLELDVTLRNDGYASPFNARPVYAVLQGNGATYEVQLAGADVDPRRWWGGQSHTFSRRLGIPASVTPGTYTLSLWLPDAAATIRTRPEYAIRFANNAVWSTTAGHNELTTQLEISASATANTGAADATFVAR